jgi:small subunit ribosomal protein S26e|mmetsp:Transcript_23331/g.55130  ORF Transcript_23331/g.55130 Transcript_23331/m.55130 type:complete len:115 (-) Transcript_23331:130-474(-)
MTVKRRNHGRNRPAGSRGKVKFVRCASTSKAISKDKAVKRFLVKNIVDASSMRDIMDACVYENYQVPKLYIKMYYCIEAAIHQRIVRGRSMKERRNREPPQRFRRREKTEKKKE